MSVATRSFLLDLSLREIAAGFRRRQWSPVEVTTAALERIQATDPTIHAWVLVDADGALTAAARAEREMLSGDDRGPLHGIPVGVKDIFDVAGLPTQCGSASRAESAPAKADAAAVTSLRRGGAIVLGKTVTQEYAAGVISAPARNPWDPRRVPGGSSGGSAAAVAVSACFAALGSDTGGSIRIPAAACGVTGLKPMFGSLDAAGVFPLAWSLDTVGPIARTVDDTWLTWKVLETAGAATADLDELSGSDLRAIRIGVPRSFFLDWVQPDIAASITSTVELLEQLGATIVDASWEDAAAARALSFVINRVETAAVHERIAVDDPARFAAYGPDMRLRVAAGREVPATLYIEALRAREIIRDSVAEHFAEHQLHAMLAPTLPTTAVLAENPVIEGTGRDESVGAGWTRLTMPFNATGQPVLALPCGHDRDGLPVGLQLAGKPGGEQELFQIGSILEGALGVREHRPPLVTRLSQTRATAEQEQQ